MATSVGHPLVPVVARSPLPEGVAVRLLARSSSSDLSASGANLTDKGRGAFATRCFPAGSVVMRELPYASIQDLSNRHRAWTCAHCSTFLQSLEGQLKWHRRNIGIILGEDEEEDNEEETQLTEGTLYCTDLVECWHACGEMYCSERCRDEAYAEYHEALCVGRVDSENHPLVVFKKHAIEHNELFMLAAHVIARIFNTIRATKDVGFTDHFLNSFCHRPWLDVLAEARESRRAAHNLRDIDSPDHAGDEDDEEDLLPHDLKQLLEESYFSLKMALFSPPSPFATGTEELGDALETLFTLDFYSNLLGLLEMNQNAMRIGSPLQEYAAMLQYHLFPSSRKSAHDGEPAVESGVMPSFGDSAEVTWRRLSRISEQLQQAEASMHDDDDDDDDDQDTSDDDYHHSEDNATVEDPHDSDDTYSKGKGKDKVQRSGDDDEDAREDERTELTFPPFEGFGLFPIAAMMNHSCAPNTIIKFERNRGALVVALRDISEGEELTHSYIENDRPLGERRADLLEYNFVCKCAKCLHEEDQEEYV